MKRKLQRGAVDPVTLTIILIVLPWIISAVQKAV